MTLMALALPLPRIAGVLVTSALAGLLALGVGKRRRSWRDALAVLKNGGALRLWRAVRIRLYSSRRSLGLRRDLQAPFTVPPAKIPVTVRPLSPDDDLSFLDPTLGLDPDTLWARLSQRSLLNDDLRTCWVAVAPGGKVCYMQWLIGPADNAVVQTRWGGLFPTLRLEEALLEGAFTADTHRGQGIMPHAMAKIAEAARELGARYVITFVGDNNVASLKGCDRAGFAPYVERRETWFMFLRWVRFRPIDNATPVTA